MIAILALCIPLAFLAGCEIGLRWSYKKEQLQLCETSLSIWDDTRSSEYWLRYPHN